MMILCTLCSFSDYQFESRQWTLQLIYICATLSLFEESRTCMYNNIYVSKNFIHT